MGTTVVFSRICFFEGSSSFLLKACTSASNSLSSSELRVRSDSITKMSLGSSGCSFSLVVFRIGFLLCLLVLVSSTGFLLMMFMG